MDDKKLVADLSSPDADVRFSAWRQAGDASASVIPQIGRLAASSDPAIAKAAREALTTMTHSVGKDPAGSKRAPVVQGLLELATGSSALPVRIHALRLLSGVAGEDAVPALAKLLSSGDLREEAIYSIERIPGNAADKALLAAYKDAKDDWKPRVLAALGHRRIPEAAPLASEAMRSTSKDVAIAGIRAAGRIGKPFSSPMRPLEIAGMTEWEKVDAMDSVLRFADAQAKRGAAAEAIRLYKSALERPEEHWQCAAVIGLAKLGTPDAVALIMPKLKSDNRRVRITAANAWKSIAAAQA